MAGSDLGLELLMQMEVAILRRTAPRSYELEGLVPSFYLQFFPRDAGDAGCRTPWNYSPMLEFFLSEAEEFFESKPKPGSNLSSGLWIENLDSGEELPLTATARILENDQLLLVQAVREEYAQRVRLMRRSRDLRSTRSDLMERRKITQFLLRTTKRKNPFDPLTKLYSREVFVDLVQAHIARLSIYAPHLALIMMSLDQFEDAGEERPAENEAGEELLRQVGHLLRRSLRKSDAAVHYGGGVFFIVAPGTTLQQSIMAAERLISLFKGYDFRIGRPLNLYLGCTSYQPGEEAKELIVRARQALMDAVKAGPNKVGQRAPEIKHGKTG
jgi:diguanylate cyclase (GGDEF)-like protein